MNNLTIFKNEEFGEIRTVQLNNETYFIASDICRALDLSNPTMALQRLDDDEKSKFNLGLPGGDTNCVNEYGLYNLVLASRKKEAREFKRWITHEVLPSIRKTGQYQMQNLSTEMKAILMHDEKIVKIESRMDKLEFDIPLYGSEADEISSHVKRKGVAILGGKQSEAYKDTNIRSKVYRDIYDQIKREFGIYSDDGLPKSYKALKRKYLFDAHELIDTYEAPKYLLELIDNANAQMALVV